MPRNLGTFKTILAIVIDGNDKIPSGSQENEAPDLLSEKIHRMISQIKLGTSETNVAMTEEGTDEKVR